MAKSELRIKARKLRERGTSVKTIAETLNISKSTASIWVRDIIMTVEQLEKLRQSELKGKELGRLRNALLQKQKRIQFLKQSKENGKKLIGYMSDRELLFTGLALYWGEGSKKQRRVELCNSDPKMIQFFLYWLHKCFKIPVTEIKCYVGINEIHMSREQTVKEYWSKITNIPLSQFTKTSFKKVNNTKVYENFNNHFGTLAIKVIKPARIFAKIIGLIEALSEISQGSSAVAATVS